MNRPESPDMLLAHLEQLLAPGEKVTLPSPLRERNLDDPNDRGDVRTVFGYDVYPIQYPDGRVNDGALIVVEPEGAVGPVAVVGDIEFTVQAVEGRGEVFVWYPDNDDDDVAVHCLDSDAPESVIIKKGAVYGYKNVGPARFIIRDDCTPEFHPEDEVSLIEVPDMEFPSSFLRRYISQKRY